MKIIWRVLGVVVLLLVVVAGVLAFNTFTFTSRQPRTEAVAKPDMDLTSAALRLGGAIRIPTVSHTDRSKIDRTMFVDFQAYLKQTFPLIHQRLKFERVGGLNLLYTWPGSDPALEPIMLTAHMDVVPIEKGTETRWTQPPFSGRIADGFIWGRGALDDKVSLMGIMEAVEMLLAKGFIPKRTVLLAFGHDEEIGGAKGAPLIAARLKADGVRAAAVLDESGVISTGLMPGVEGPVALIGIAEKGYLSLKLTAATSGGHSSMPAAPTAIGSLASAVAKLEAEPFPARLDETTGVLFEWIGPEMSQPLKAVFANAWLLGPVIKAELAAKPSTDATIRTTTAPTIFNGGNKDNLLPTRARAVVNFRILPGETTESVTARVKQVIDDPAIEVSPLFPGVNPTRVSDPADPAFALLTRTIGQIFPGVIIGPYLVMAGTDARHYQDISDNILRFLPIRLAPEDLDRIHGTNERLAVDNYGEVVAFYRQYILNWNL